MEFNLEKNSFLSICLFLIFLYIFSSFQELLIHKYIMHNDINLPYFKETYQKHIKHHIDTNKDFTIKDNNISNICFSFMTILPTFIVNVFVLYILFNTIVSLEIIIISIFLVLVAHMVIWNTMHCYVHYFDVNKICKNTIYGLPKEYINENNIYVNWSLENHKAHHYYKGEEKGNWNVVLPGADFILGTHNTLPQ